MNYKELKEEFIKIKKEELNYINNTAYISNSKTLSEYEKLEIYRTLKNYETKLEEISKKLHREIVKEMRKNKESIKDNLDKFILEFSIDKNCLSSLNLKHEEVENVLEDLGIEHKTMKFKLNLENLIYYRKNYTDNAYEIATNKQQLIEKTIYIFSGYCDTSLDCLFLGDPNDYIYAIYENIRSRYSPKKEIRKKEIHAFEKDKIIIRSNEYVFSHEVRKIFEEELLNTKNRTINDCVIQTKQKVKELNYTRSPEYKEKILLNKIDELYKKVKGEFIKKEILYSGNFLEILKETYKLPNGNTVEKEKVIKNHNKNSVIVIAITQDKEYIITFQNRIKGKLIAEFPSGYIENTENPIQAAKRELKEETGYITDDLFIIDEAYTSPGTDNSITYIVIANNCAKTNEKNISGTELVNYGLFSEKELGYLISKNIISGAMNKLAYYNLINNADNCNVTHIKRNINNI